MEDYGSLPWWPSFRTTGGRVHVRPLAPPTAWRTSRSSSGRLAVLSPWKNNRVEVNSWRSTLPPNTSRCFPPSAIQSPHRLLGCLLGTPAGRWLWDGRWMEPAAVCSSHAIWIPNRWQHIQLITKQLKSHQCCQPKRHKRNTNFLQKKEKTADFSVRHRAAELQLRATTCLFLTHLLLDYFHN